ncbi:MAG: hypothetical protein HYX68_19525 [Planctomycetes bacterium]|nr:hypothetical protein [Planctomycetota bacterium]
MSIQVECDCGRMFRVKDDKAGRKVRCPECDEVVRVPEAEEEEDDSASAIAVAPKLPPRKPPKPTFDDADDEPRQKSRRRVDEDEEEGEDEDRRRPKSKRRRDDDDEPDDRRRSRSRDKSDASFSQPSTALATIGVGLLMILGSIVWFVGGLFFDIIFFYPPVLFVLGIIAVVRGAMQRS